MPIEAKMPRVIASGSRRGLGLDDAVEQLPELIITGTNCHEGNLRDVTELHGGRVRRLREQIHLRVRFGGLHLWVRVAVLVWEGQLTP